MSVTTLCEVAPAVTSEAVSTLVDDLYREHHSAVRDYLYRMCRNTHLADDLTSETFIRALNHATSNGFNVTMPRAWLRAVAKNLLIDHYRRGAPELTVEPDEMLQRAHRAYETAPPSAQDDLLETVVRILGDLTTDQRDAMVLTAVDGYSVREVAEIMGRSEQAIWSLRHKAVRRLVAKHTPTAAAPLEGEHAS